MFAVILTGIAVLATYILMKMKYNYWSKKGVANPTPLPFIGNMLSVVTMRQSTGDLCCGVYKKYRNEKMVGIYDMFTPTLIVRDLDLMERVLVKHFQHFSDHTSYFDLGMLFSNGLFQMNGKWWRSARYEVSPSFTSGKLRLMYEQIFERTNELVKNINENLEKDYEIKKTLKSFSLDIIVNSLFGIEITNREARLELMERGASIFDISSTVFLRILMLTYFPNFAKKFGIKFLRNDSEQYFYNLLQKIFQEKSPGKYHGHDCVQLLLKLKEKGEIPIISKDHDKDDEEDEVNNRHDKIEITEEFLIGQAFQFLTGAFDPLFNSMVYTMYEMSRFPETQLKARKEIKEVLAKHGGYKYEAIREMDYLEQCIKESLRLHPLTDFLIRQCSKPYVTEEGVVIEKGMRVIVPITAVHMDPQHYPNPEIYNPDRFASDPKKLTFIPFGYGPRMCLGSRYAMLAMKIGLARIIENFKFTLSPLTRVPLVENKLSFFVLPIGKVYFNVSLAKDDD